ncbi:MAG: hypothetical protein ABW085_11490 [Sedimenticola sp.]
MAVLLLPDTLLPALTPNEALPSPLVSFPLSAPTEVLELPVELSPDEKPIEVPKVPVARALCPIATPEVLELEEAPIATDPSALLLT